MRPHPVFIVGVAIFFLSAVAFLGILFAKGGWKRSKQFGVIVALFRGEHGTFSRWLMIGSFLGIVFGALVQFAGVAANDVARENLCQARCVAAGYPRGTIGPSMEQNMARRNSPAFVACNCTGGTLPPLELHADSL